jgi:hypothetical protein
LSSKGLSTAHKPQFIHSTQTPVYPQHTNPTPLFHGSLFFLIIKELQNNIRFCLKFTKSATETQKMLELFMETKE